MAGTSNTPSTPAVGAKVVVRKGVAGDEPAPGTIVDDFGPAQKAVGDDLGRDWAPVRRWAVALDDGRLIFVDEDAFESPKDERSDKANKSDETSNSNGSEKSEKAEKAESPEKS